ncbi:MAG TPA: hypothetical protein CFH82_07010 [Sulfurospirillum sp. UBA12182]|nr:MAG TPA: hypothetical protein CFH82_07010 [Sulfurospirillum sp. UBA12182]
MKGDGVFKVRAGKIYVHGTINGIFYRKSTGRTATKLSLAWMKKQNPMQVLEEILQNENQRIESTTFESFGYEVVNLTKSNRGISTQNDWKSLFKNKILPYFKHYRFEDVRPIDVVNFLESHRGKLSNDRVKKLKYILRTIFAYAEENGLMVKNPVTSISVSQVNLKYKPKNTPSYTTDEIAKILKHAKGWMKVFLDLSFTLGLRTGETIGLKWEDFDFETGKLHLKRSISKSQITEQNSEQESNKNHFRVLQLFPQSLELLKKYYEFRPDDEWLFINKDGNNYGSSQMIIRTHFKPFLKEIGVPYKTLYATRRSYASVMKYAGENLGVIQKTMGHAQGSKITEKHYISPKVLNLKHEQAIAQRQENMFKTMIFGA